MVKFIIFESTLTAHNYRVGNFTLVFYDFSSQLQGWELFWNLSFLKNSKKNHKNRRISKIKKVWAFLIGARICNSWDYSDSTQLQVRNFKKITKNVISGKLHGFEQSYLETKFTTPESTLAEPHYTYGNFKFYKKLNTQVLWKTLRKS